MLKRLIVAGAILIAWTASAFAYDDDAIVRKCDAKWGGDFSMVAYCREQQRAAGETVDQLRNRASNEPVIKTILDGCEGKWGTDYSMVAYCAEQQSESYQALSSVPDDVPADVTTDIKRQCDAKWGTDYSMVAYCVEQQTNAWRSIQ